MPIPNAKHAVVPESKLRDYLLNSKHPIGGSKARWFGSFGYREQDKERLALDLHRLVEESENFLDETTEFGVKYIVKGKLETPNGVLANVVTVWIAEYGTPEPRLVTAYPDEKNDE